MSHEIPIIDGNTLAPVELDRACRQWGLFYLANHGIDPSLVDAMQQQMERFFAQSKAQKITLERTDRNAWGFYDRELTKNRQDWKEIFDVGPAETQGPLAGAMPQWPDLNGFEDTLRTYAAAAHLVALKLLHALSTNLGMPADHLDEAFGVTHTSFLRLNYYPTCATAAPPTAATVPTQGELGIGHHTDAGALTLLLQGNVEGLQVQHDKHWITVRPRADTLVVNLGDIMQVWSNERYLAPVHRVFASASTRRYSAPYFFNPSYATNYAPLPSLLANGVNARYQVINWGEFRAGRSAGDYADHGKEIQISDFQIQSA